MEGNRIVSATFETGGTVKAAMFINASYEGGYDPARHGLLVRCLNPDPQLEWKLNHTTKPMTDGPLQMRGGDSNHAGSFSPDLADGSHRWPDGTFEPVDFARLPPPRCGPAMPFRELYQLQERISRDHVTDQQELLYFPANDPQVHRELQNGWGVSGWTRTSSGQPVTGPTRSAFSKAAAWSRTTA